MTNGKIFIFVLVCFAAFQVTYGLRVRRQSAGSAATQQNSTTPTTGPSGSSNNQSSGTPSAAAASAASQQNSTTPGSGSSGSTNDNTTNTTPTNSGSAAVADFEQRLTKKIQELLSDPGTIADIDAKFQDLMIKSLGLDEATVAGMTPNQIKANYIDYLLVSDALLERLFPELRQKLAPLK